MGNVIVKKQVISSALALTVIAGDLEHLEQRQRKRKNKNSIPSKFKTPAYIGEEWKAPEGLDKKKRSFNI